MPPSSENKTEQHRGAATPQEAAFSDISLSQAGRALDLFGQATADPRIASQTIDQDISAKQSELARAQQEMQTIATHISRDGGAWIGGYDAAKEKLAVAQRQVANAESSIRQLQGQKTILPKQVADYEQIQDIRNRTSQRILDIIEGRDLGVSAQEQALIAQGISGLSQDVATTRGLNRTDVPVMQAIAPTVANALLSQANANRSLFTGINQFQQGMDLSGRQLQAGLAGQNPAANLTGVYSGLRSTSTTGSSQQNYGALDYVSGIGKLASGAGGLMTGVGALSGGGGGAMFQGGLGLGGGVSNMYSAPIGPVGPPQ